MAPDDENARPDLGEPSRKTSQKSQRRRIEAERKKERETKKKQERKGEAQDKGEGKEELEEEEDKEEGNEEEKQGERKEKDQDRRKRPLMKGLFQRHQRGWVDGARKKMVCVLWLFQAVRSKV